MDRINNRPKSRESALYTKCDKQAEYYKEGFKKNRIINIILNIDGYTELKTKK